MLADAEMVYSALPKTRGNQVSFETFEKSFKSEVPSGTEFEIKVVRTVREWMFQHHLSSEMAWDTLCRAAGRFVQRTLSRADFHRAFQACDIGISAAYTDSLFTHLGDEAIAEIGLPQWQSKIFEDGDNPLQMIREIVQAYDLTQDDLLFQMKLKVWDNPLDYSAFYKAVRYLDSTIGDS